MNTALLADQDMAFLAYQEALVFNFGGHVFNALTILMLGSYTLTGTNVASMFVPNVNNRPKRLNNGDWLKLVGLAQETYLEACELYEREEAKAKLAAFDLTEAIKNPGIDND